MKMRHPIKTVCVYCGSRMGAKPDYAEMATDLGTRIAKAGMSLIYGAGSIGLMGTVARAARDGGSAVIGVIPDHLDAVEITQEGLAELYVTKNMHERKRMMFDRSDAFIVLPGGLGTLDEMFEIMTWAQLGLHEKPILLLNHDGFWNPLLGLIDHLVDQGFAAAKNAALLNVVDSPEAALAFLARHTTSDTAQSQLF